MGDVGTKVERGVEEEVEEEGRGKREGAAPGDQKALELERGQHALRVGDKHAPDGGRGVRNSLSGGGHGGGAVQDALRGGGEQQQGHAAAGLLLAAALCYHLLL